MIKLRFRMNSRFRMNLGPKPHMLPCLFGLFGPLFVRWRKKMKIKKKMNRPLLDLSASPQVKIAICLQDFDQEDEPSLSTVAFRYADAKDIASASLRKSCLKPHRANANGSNDSPVRYVARYLVDTKGQLYSKGHVLLQIDHLHTNFPIDIDPSGIIADYVLIGRSIIKS